MELGAKNEKEGSGPWNRKFRFNTHDVRVDKTSDI